MQFNFIINHKLKKRWIEWFNRLVHTVYTLNELDIRHIPMFYHLILIIFKLNYLNNLTLIEILSSHRNYNI